MILVVSGPGGVGKGTLVARLVDEDPGLWLSRSWTTRERRPGEPEDAYQFVDRATFEDRVADDGFLEWAEFLGHLYGTPRPDPGPGHDIVLEIDVQGAAQVREQYPEAVLVLLQPPSRDELEQRLRGRGDPPEQVRQRLDKADEEVAAALELGAHVVVNADLDAAVDEVRGLVEQARRGAAGYGSAAPRC